MSLRIKFRSANLDQFIERYAIDVSRGGIFIRTREPLAVGTQLKFDFQLQDSAPLLAGDGTVVWIREHDPARAGVTPGMGVRFDKLTPASQPVLEKILTDKATRDQSGLGGASALRVGPGGRRPSSTFSAVDPTIGRTGDGAGGAPRTASAPLTPGGLPSTPLTLPPNRNPTPAPHTLTPPPAGAPLPRRTPAAPPGALGAARATGLRPAIGSPGTPLAVPGGRPASTGADPAAARARANTGIGMVRPAPAAPSLFEPPTSEDIDKALESLKEAPVGDAHAAAAAPPSPAAPTAAVVDYPSNEPTRITDLPASVDLDSAAVAAAPPSLEGPPRRTGTQPLFPGEPARATGAPRAAIEPEPSDRTDLTLDPGSTSVVAPIPPIAPPSTAPSPRFTPAGGGRVSASMALAGDSESQRLASRDRRSKAPVIVVGVVLTVSTAAAGFFFLNRAPAQKGAESAASAPAAAAPAAAAPATTPPPAGAAPENAAAAAEKKPEEAQAAAAKSPTPPAPEPAKAAVVAPAPPPPAPAPVEKSLHGPARKAALARRKLAAKGPETAAAAPAAAPAEAAPTPPAKVEVVGQGDADDKAAAKDDKDKDKDKKDDAAAAGQSQHVLRVISTPPGAEVVVDGASVGRTPFLGNQIDPASPHAITLKKDGYENHEHMIGSSDWSHPRNGVQSLKLTVKLRKAGGGGDKAKPETEAAAPAAEGATPAAKKDDKKDEAPASP